MKIFSMFVVFATALLASNFTAADINSGNDRVNVYTTKAKYQFTGCNVSYTMINNNGNNRLMIGDCLTCYAYPIENVQLNGVTAVNLDIVQDNPANNEHFEIVDPVCKFRSVANVGGTVEWRIDCPDRLTTSDFEDAAPYIEGEGMSCHVFE